MSDPLAKDVGSKFRNAIQEKLAPGEEVQVGVILASAEFNRWKPRLFVTDRNIITVKKNLIGSQSRTIPLDTISDIETVEHKAFKIEIEGRNGVDETYIMGADDGRKVLAAIRSGMNYS